MSTDPHSQTVCFAAPLLPGTTSLDRDEMMSCWNGERREEHDESRRALGITREAVWIQPTPAGDVALVLIEATDLAAALYGIATSTSPFDASFRDHLAAVHGMDLTAGMVLPEAVLDFRG